MGEFDMIIGVALLGLFINTYLYGLVTYQFIVYHTTNFNDRIWIKAVVGSLFVLDTVQSAVDVYVAWDMCVTNYNNPAALLLVSWTVAFSGVINAICALIVQAFLSHRVYAVTRSKPLVAFIGCLSVVGCFLGVYASIYARVLYHVELFPKLDPFLIPWLCSQTAVDVIITASLTFVLIRSRTGFNRRMDTIINRIIRGAVETGLFGSIFALGAVLSFLFARQTSLWALFAYPLGRIYTNTLLDTLNARTAFRNIGTSEVHDDEAVSYRMHIQTHSVANHGVHSIHVQKEVINDLVKEESVVDSKYPVHEE